MCLLLNASVPTVLAKTHYRHCYFLTVVGTRASAPMATKAILTSPMDPMHAKVTVNFMVSIHIYSLPTLLVFCKLKYQKLMFMCVSMFI